MLLLRVVYILQNKNYDASNAFLKTSSYVEQKMKLTSLRIFSGSSSTSLRFASGNNSVLTPARRAAIVFSLTPPIRKTFPVSEISPVMPTSGRIGRFNARDINDDT